MGTLDATTWDGKPISPDPPHGCTVVVYRCGPDGLQLLMLHRAHRGPDFEGDWAWTPPAGCRLPGEPVLECAARELWEETGLRLPLEPTLCGTQAWYVYLAEASAGAQVVLDAEHDRYEWVGPEEALRRCRPDAVREPLARAIAELRRRQFRSGS